METRDTNKGTSEFVGYVTGMAGGRFTAILRDVSDPEKKYVATFDMDKDVSEEDAPLVEIGAAFHLIVRDGGPKAHFLRFNRPSSISDEDIERIKEEAERLNQAISWE